MIKDLVTALLKAIGALVVLTAVWFASGEYQRRHFKEDFDNVVQIRVRRECLRPEWIHTSIEAQEYDVTVREMDVLAMKVERLKEQTSSWAEQANRVETLWTELSGGKIPLQIQGGVGGPAPKRRQR